MSLAPPRFLEFQASANLLLVGFGNEAKAQSPCMADAFSLPDSPCSGVTMLDRIVFHDPVLVPGAILGAVRIEQPISAFIVPTADLPANGAAATPPCQTVEATLRFNVTVDVQAGNAVNTIAFAGLVAPALSAQAVTALSFHIVALFPPQSRPFDLEPLSELLGGTPVVSRAQIATTSDGSRFAIRLLIEGGGDLPESSWAAFEAGAFKPNGGNVWSIYHSRGLLEEAIERRVSVGLEESEADNKIEVDSWPDATLLPLLVPTMSVEFNVDAIDACVCAWDEIDLDVDVTALLMIAVPTPNALQIDLFLSWDLNDAEVVCCAFSAALMWPFVGTNLLQEEGLGAGWFVAGLFALPVTFTAFIALAHDVATKPIGAGVDAEWTEISKGKHYRLTEDFGLNQFDTDLTLDHASVQSSGLILGGTTGPLQALLQPVLSISTKNFTDYPWSVSNPCDPPAQMVVSTTAYIQAQAAWPPPGVSPDGVLPLQICDVRIVSDDPENQFTPFFTWQPGDQVLINFTIPSTELRPDYVAAPYTCSVRIVTNAGIRVVTIGPLPSITDEEVAALIQDAADSQFIKCQSWAWQEFWHAKIFLPRWWPDPPDSKVNDYVQIWRVVASGFQAAERVTLQDVEGRAIGTSTSTSGRLPAVELLADVSAKRGDQTGIALQRTEETVSGRTEIAIRQLALQHTATFGIGGHVVGWCPIAQGTRSRVAIATTWGIEIYDLLATSMRLREYIGLDGLKGIVSWKSGLLAWGTFGARMVRTRNALSLTDRPVQGIARDRGRVYVLGADAVTLYDAEGRVTARVAIDNGTEIAASHGMIAIARETALTVLDGQSLSPRGHIAAERPKTLTPTTYGALRSAWFADVQDRTIVYGVDVAELRGGITALADYARRPLLAGALRFGRLFAVLNVDRGELSAYRVGPSVMMRR